MEKNILHSERNDGGKNSANPFIDKHDFFSPVVNLYILEQAVQGSAKQFSLLPAPPLTHTLQILQSVHSDASLIQLLLWGEYILRPIMHTQFMAQNPSSQACLTHHSFFLQCIYFTAMTGTVVLVGSQLCAAFSCLPA